MCISKEHQDVSGWKLFSNNVSQILKGKKDNETKQLVFTNFERDNFIAIINWGLKKSIKCHLLILHFCKLPL